MKEITFDCPSCGLPLTVPENAASHTGPCPECGEEITGPGLNPEEDAQPDAPPSSTKPEPKSEPIPDADQSEPPAPPVGRSRLQLGLGTVAALCIVSSAACLSLGYQLGRSATASPDPRTVAPAQSDAPLPPPAIRETPTAASPPTPILVTSTVAVPVPDPTPDAMNPADPTPDKAALLRFLSATSWTTRRGLVLHAEHVAAQMESLAKTRGDGPIKATRITPVRQIEQSAVFKVSTDSHPEGFHVVLSLVDDRWLVDWSGFAEFYYELFQSFVSGTGESSGTFRLLIKPELAGLGDTGRQPYAASVPGPDKPTIIFAAEDSPVYQTLEDTIGALAAEAPGYFRRLMESGGLPLLLHVSKTVEGEQTNFMIDRIVAQNWNPQPPETP